MKLALACALACWIGAFSVACGGGGDDRPQAVDPSNNPTNIDDDGPRPDDDDDDPADSGDGEPESEVPSEQDAGATPTSLDAGSDLPTNCGDLTCRGHGSCVLIEGLANCVCDEGYVAVGEDDSFECVVDTSCKKLYLLENNCRQFWDWVPAVATFFAVDYCAGTAVLPEDLGDLDEAFQILENGVDISENPESVARVIERDVESFVAIALDVSKSVTGVEGDAAKAEALSALIRELRAFVGALRAPEGEPDVTLSVIVFGRFVAEYVPFTTDLDAVDVALSRIETNPDEVVSLVGGDGTALRGAVEVGIHSVERVQSLRSLVSDIGVLSSGALVVVTDGRDSSNADLNEGLIEDTKVSLISIGISSDIDDDELRTIGRDGSFLAPTPGDWEESFAEIAQRVDEYPDRAYLLAYCSSATSGSPTVSVKLRGEEHEITASCEFNADIFSSDVEDVCDLELFETHCDTVECGSLFACGACANDECCAGGRCRGPSANTQSCHEQHQLCATDGLVCVEDEEAEDGVEDPFYCQTPLPDGDECEQNDDLCALGQSFCDEVSEDEFQCVPVTLANGDVCGDDEEHDARVCPELNCSQRNPDNPADPYICQREARIFERCSGNSADAVCEPGSHCQGGICRARTVYSCTQDEQCLSGYCFDTANQCVETGFCHFDWNSVLD